MTIRGSILKCISSGKPPEEVAQLVMGFLSNECGLDNGNGWYDDDADMADGGLGEAEVAWSKFKVSNGEGSPFDEIMASGDDL